MRQLVFVGGPALGFLAVTTEVAVLALLAVLFVGLAWRWLARIERLAIREGTLFDQRR
jgi:membrane protein implicated in regulation of membrane protease activity